MTEPSSLFLQLWRNKDYRARLAWIEANLARIDDSFVDFLNQVVASNDSPELKISMARLRALTLAEITFVHGRIGNTQIAKRLASHCLKAFQQALLLFGEQGIDLEDSSRKMLEAMMADASEFRAVGLEEEGWQAYWIADPIFEAIEMCDQRSDIKAGKLLIAALTLEQVGLRQRAKIARQRACEQSKNDTLFEKEKRLAESLFNSALNELPAPIIYAADSRETAYRFSSHMVAMYCVRQTRCPLCHGAMLYKSKELAVGRGKVYDIYRLECQDNNNHPALTVYSDASQFPGMQSLAEAGEQIEEIEENELKQVANPLASPSLKTQTKFFANPSLEQARSADEKTLELSSAGTNKLIGHALSKADPKIRARSLNLIRDYPGEHRKTSPLFTPRLAAVLIVIFFWISVVPTLVCYFLFKWLSMPMPYWKILLGCAAGLAIQYSIRIIARLVVQSRRGGPKTAPVVATLVVVLSLLAGAGVAFFVGGLPGGVGLLLAAMNLRMIIKRANNSKLKWSRVTSPGKI